MVLVRRNQNPMHVRNRKVVIATPKRVDDKGDEAAEGYDLEHGLVTRKKTKGMHSHQLSTTQKRRMSPTLQSIDQTELLLQSPPASSPLGPTFEQQADWKDLPLR